MAKFSKSGARSISGLAVLFLTFCLIQSAFGQVRPIYDRGAAGLGQMIKRIGNTKRVMHIGAHPDDEDSDMLAYLARKENARTVYLSLTRGDGGQNVIGPELFEALGVIRTEELLQARTLDGAEQMFTRAFDYGFSKTLDEAKAKWDIETIKCDVVKAIRTFRPQVVIPRFGGTPNDGHGQHQYAGYITPIAVRAASDPTQCKDAGPVWRVSKLYVGQGFRDTNAPSLQMNSGEYDYLIGRSYYEIAAQGRSQHKTQEQGGLELRGDRFSGVNLVESDLVVRGAEDSVFDGLDTSFRSMAENEGLAAELSKIETDFSSSISEIGLLDSQKAKVILLDLRAKLLGLIARNPGMQDSSRSNISEKVAEVDRAIGLAAGLQIDALSNAETVTDEESLGANVNVFFPEDAGIVIKDIALDAPEGWEVSAGKSGAADDSPRARFFRESPSFSKSFAVSVPGFSAFTQPYFLEQPRKGYLYHWENDRNQNRPFQGSLVSAVVIAEIDGTEIEFRKPVEYRYADDTRGELRRNLNVVPKVSVDLDQHLIVIKKSAIGGKYRVSVNVQNNYGKAFKGQVSLEAPAGWVTKTQQSGFEMSKKGDVRSFDFEIGAALNAKPGDYVLRAVVDIDGRKYSQTLNTIAYEHIQTHRYYTPAETKVAVMNLEVAPVKIGYVMGSGDSGPEALHQMGLDVEMLDGKELTNGDLTRFDTIVIGIRASETNPDYIANNQRLLDYVKAGGTMIVQYQKNAFQSLGLAPFPIQIGARVAEEDAKMTILEPSHPVFNLPNKITQDDFEDWVQERNLYALRSFDERYTPLLESHDTGEEPNKGGLVYAKIGKGQYVYVSYAFFRQLPAGVPGAYRLFANIVSLGKGKSRG